jgi:hypothetical protein
MVHPKTHFERIPLEIVKKIAKEEIQPEETIEPTQEIRKSTRERDRPRAGKRRSRSTES